MSENSGQKKGSNRGKTEKGSGSTNEVADFSTDQASYQWEIATKKNKKKRNRSQKNGLSLSANDASEINDQGGVVDESQELKIGDCVENQNEKPPKKNNLDNKKKEGLSSNSLDVVSNKENGFNNDFPILKANDVTKEGTNKKTRKTNIQLENVNKNELGTKKSCPEKIIKNVQSVMTVDSKGPQENENSATKESEEMSKRKRKRRKNKSKSALEPCSSGKSSEGSIESITEANSDEDNKEEIEDKKITIDFNEKCLSNTNKTVETAYRAPTKRKNSINLDEETKNERQKVSGSIDVIDFKQKMDIENSGIENTTSKRRKKNKKSKNEELSENMGNKDCHIEEKEESEQSLTEQNTSKLSAEIEEDLKNFQDNCKILDSKIKGKQHKNSNKSVSSLPIVSDKKSTNQFSPPPSTSSTTTPPVEIVPPAEKLDAVEILKKVDKKCKKSKSKNKQTATIESFVSKDRQPPLVTKVDENLETKREVTPIISEKMRSGTYEKAVEDKSDQKLLNEKLVEDQYEHKISKSKKKHDSVIVKAPNKQSDVKSNKKSDKNNTLKVENEAHQMLESSVNEEQYDDTLKFKKIEQKNSIVEAIPALGSEKNDDSQTVLYKNVVNNNIELKKIMNKTSKSGSSHDLDSKVALNIESQIERVDNTNIQNDDSKKKKSKSKKKKNSIQQVASTDISKMYKEKVVGDKSQPVLETNAKAEVIIEIPSEETTSTVELITNNNRVPENDSKVKKCVSFRCEPILFNHVNQEDEDDNRMSENILIKRSDVENEILEEINNSDVEQVLENDQSSLVSTAPINFQNHDESYVSNSELYEYEADNNYATNTTLQPLYPSDMQEYDWFAISEAEKRFAKLLESEYNASMNDSSNHNTDPDVDMSNDYYRNTTDLDIDSSNYYKAKTTESGINLSNHYEKYTESDDSIIDNYSNTTDDPLIINHYEVRDEELPEEVRSSNLDLQRFSDNFTIPTSSNNEKLYDSQCTLSWSQVAAKETKTKFDVSQDHASSENQQKNIQKSFESPKPVCIIVTDRPSRADTDIAEVDSEGFVKYISKREMRKQRSRTSSRNDEQEVSQAIQEIQDETSIYVAKKSDSKVISESADESNPLKSNAFGNLLETGIWMDKWKYHDAEVEFFESKEKIRNSPASAIFKPPTSDNDDNECSSASEPPSPAKGKRRKSRRKRKRKKDNDMLSEADDSNYTSDEDLMNLNNHVATPPGDSKIENTHRIENDISHLDIDSHISNTNPNSSRKIKQLFVMILMELYFMLMYYASGLKKRKKVE